MSIQRRLAAAVSLAIGLPLALPAGAQAAPASPSLPQPAAAQAAGRWLASQINSQGFVPSSPGASTASLSSTAQVVLALSAVNVDIDVAQRALSYLQANFDTYVKANGSDGPGQLALLILDVKALGRDPRNFGGVDLVARLLATQQAGGTDAGLFGTEAQVANYSAGNYQQGLALSALAASGVKNTAATASAVSWLEGQQCPDGGWTSPDNAQNACNGTPANYGGPDTNSTSLAVQGLVAQGTLTPAVSAKALGFLTTGQDSDAGWSNFPNTATTPGVTDPDSTALVIQALIAMGQSPTGSAFAKGSASPVSALLSFQLSSGSGSGAFYFPPAPAPASLIATYQAVPALVGLPFGWMPSGGYWEVASDGGVFTFGNASFYGSMGGRALTAPVVGVAATPDGRGYWEVASDGGVFAFGDASFYGSMGGQPLTRPVVGVSATPDGRGYREVASDGGIFSFGDAGFYGSMGGETIASPVVAIATDAG